MKTRYLAGVLVLVSLFTSLLAGPRDAAWGEVDEAVNRGLPKTAIERLDQIIVGTQADRAYAEAIKAIGRRIALEGVIQGNKPEEKIVRLEAEIAKAPAEMKPVMEAILGHWYWQYFQRNRGRFQQRTQTAAVPAADIQTWDLARIVDEIGRHFDAALADTATLQATPVATFDALIEKGNVPDAYRPTLFDFLAYEALSFYQAGEQAETVAEDAFEIEAASPIFGDTAAFLAWKPSAGAPGKPGTSDPAAPQLKAIALYQALLRFHQNDADRSAFLDADLARIAYGHNVAIGDDQPVRYKAALERFADTALKARHEIAARALAVLAEQLGREEQPAQAHAVALRGHTAFPESAGGIQCFNLVQNIEAKEASLQTEQVWNAPWPTLDITYRNVTKVCFRAIALKFEDCLQGDFDLDENHLRELLARKPALAWEADLPATIDFKERTEKLPAPTTLKPGFYVIIASHEPGFGDRDNQISVAPVWVSELALVLRNRWDDRQQDGLVLQANSGEPVAGATVGFWDEDHSGGHRLLASRTTDENGRFLFPEEQKGESVLILAEHDGQAVSNFRPVYLNHRSRSEDELATRTIFFTDRALYRPGQTINYKGVAIRYDQDAGRYAALAGEALTVLFCDPNGKEIDRAEQRTNDYGSFSGVFTAPRDRLTGQMSIAVEGRRQSQASFSVEEYKRPKFQVTLEAPAAAAKLEAPVVVTGKATAYTSAAIGGAKVSWRVERGVQLPRWCWWWQPPASKAVAHGTAVTADDGSFKVEFTAEPDRSVPTKNEPVFTYTVHADVTDTTGETRTADRAVRAGYTALQAMIAADEWQTSTQP